MPDDKVTRTLDALVEEAYQRELDRGVAITNPDGWRAFKRKVYADTARREGAGYLRKHYERLGLGPRHIDRPKCPKCGASIITPTQRDDDPATTYCSYECAGIRTMTFAEYAATLPPDERAKLAHLLPRQEGAA